MSVSPHASVVRPLTASVGGSSVVRSFAAAAARAVITPLGGWTNNGNGSYTKAVADFFPIGCNFVAGDVGKTIRFTFTVTAITAGTGIRAFNHDAAGANQQVDAFLITAGQTYVKDIPVLYDGTGQTGQALLAVWLDDNATALTLSNISFVLL